MAMPVLDFRQNAARRSTRRTQATLVTDVRKLRSTYSRSEVKERTQAAIKASWKPMDDLQRWKREHGYCTAGLTCMHPVLRGSDGKPVGRACAHHQHCKEEGIRLMAPRFQSEYGRLRQFEIEAEREKRAAEKERRKHQKTRRRAA